MEKRCELEEAGRLIRTPAVKKDDTGFLRAQGPG